MLYRNVCRLLLVVQNNVGQPNPLARHPHDFQAAKVVGIPRQQLVLPLLRRRRRQRRQPNGKQKENKRRWSDERHIHKRTHKHTYTVYRMYENVSTEVTQSSRSLFFFVFFLVFSLPSFLLHHSLFPSISTSAFST